MTRRMFATVAATGVIVGLNVGLSATNGYSSTGYSTDSKSTLSAWR